MDLCLEPYWEIQNSEHLVHLMAILQGILKNCDLVQMMAYHLVFQSDEHLVHLMGTSWEAVIRKDLVQMMTSY